jgi:hypothetical protein
VVGHALPRPARPRHPPCAFVCVRLRSCQRPLVGPGGVEPPPSRLSGARSPAELGAPRPGPSQPGQSWAAPLPRKEVIQPHLPIRLPCYDFTPITPPTVDGVPAGFGCERLSWCDGRCVQGPGTHSPPRADGRLLAIPASRRRVAACDPNYDAVSGFAPARAVAPHCRRHCSTCVAQAIKAMRI